jgi:hypothetical protein
MVAIMQSLPQAPERLQKADERVGSIATLKRLHAEAEETAQLANLLGRSLYAGIALPILGVLTVGMSVEMSPTPQLVWCGFVAAVAGAMLLAYRNAMRRPFERPALKDFAKDLSAILLFAGFAWGSGAFLALPAGTTAIAAVLFVTAPAMIIAYLLRDREALLLFLAPAACLTLVASLLKPYEGGVVVAALVLAASAAVACAAILYERVAGLESKPAMLSLP